MPLSKNPLLRIVVPIALLVGLGTLVFWSVVRNTTGGSGPKPAAAAPVAQPAAPGPPAGSPASPPSPSVPQPPPAPTAAPGTYSAELFPGDSAASNSYSPIGSLDKASGFEMEVQFDRFGAGVSAIRLTNSFESTEPGSPHDEIQALVKRAIPDAAGNSLTHALAPFAAIQVVLNGQGVPLFADAPIWRQTAPGQFEAFVKETAPAGTRVARITRQFRLEPGRFDLVLDQRITNLTDKPISVVWRQYGPIDLPRGKVGYGGDTRRIRFGYLFNPTTDPTQQFVEAGGFLTPHADAVGNPLDAGRTTWPDKTLWPNAKSQADSLTVVWAATTNRYFAAAIFPASVPAVAAGNAQPLYDKRFQLAASINRYVLHLGTDIQGRPEEAVILGLTSPPMTLGPGQIGDVSHGVYAGPLSRAVIEAPPPAAAKGSVSILSILGLDKVVIYTFGGPCAFCTFQWITSLLRGFLGGLHDYVLHDWSLAIIVLVLCVRTILHPVTKWSQSNIQRFSKQMQKIAPKQKALQEKFKDDPAKLREEMSRLMREENISYAGALGCLPMLLQTPIWIALFAMLYFTYELRHQAGFFGVFQAVTGQRWGFLADLAEPDHFIPFGRAFNVPLLSSVMGPIESINILPIVLGIVFFIQQKYLTPPPTTALTPEQESQQKMMKVMTVIMFPLFMYNVPSGLALYTMTNSMLGIVESRYIRAHVERLDAQKALLKAAGVGTSMFDRKDRNVPRKKGLLDRIRDQVEAVQKAREQARKRQDRDRPKR